MRAVEGGSQLTEATISSNYLSEASHSARSTSASSGGVACSRISSLMAPPLTLESHEETSFPTSSIALPRRRITASLIRSAPLTE